MHNDSSSAYYFRDDTDGAPIHNNTECRLASCKGDPGFR